MPSKKGYGKKKRRMTSRQFFESGMVEYFSDGSKKIWNWAKDGTGKLMSDG